MDDLHQHDPAGPAGAPRFCGCCGGLVPRTSPLPDPHLAVVCGQCGGPADPHAPTEEFAGPYADPVPWPLCGLCLVVGRGPYADAAVLADVMAERAADPQLAALAFRLACETVSDQASHPGIGWGAFARRMDVLRPYCRSRTARTTDAPGARWEHLPPLAVRQVAADLEVVRAARAPVAHPDGESCSRCGSGWGPPRGWTRDAMRRAVCGLCADRASGAVPVPVPWGLRQLAGV